MAQGTNVISNFSWTRPAQDKKKTWEPDSTQSNHIKF